MIFWLIVLVFMPAIIGIGLSWKSSLLLENNSIWQLLISKEWKPLSGKFGFSPFIISSLWVTILALLIAGPVCLLSAIHLTQYTKKNILNIMQPVIDILAGIPSVIYGVWGIIIIVPFVAHKIAVFLDCKYRVIAYCQALLFQQ